MIALLGDIHGVDRSLEGAVSQASAAGASVVVQVGDFGVYPGYLERLAGVAERSPIPIYFIDGNHEDFRMVAEWWARLEAAHESVHHVVRDRLMYVRRGSVLEMDGRRIAFLGGAGSIDYLSRRPGVDWFAEEQIREMDLARLSRQAAGKAVDLLVTHAPPRRVVLKHFDTPPERALMARAMFGAPPDWDDPSVDKVELAWQRLGFPPLWCGHMHVSLSDENVRLLDIDELALV
jgi:predicted phosphodiesterase